MDTTLLSRLLGARRAISPLAPVAAPQFDLARFRAGDEMFGQVLQRFTDGAYKLLIDGKPARVALPTEHQPGEQVRLRVVSGRDGPRLTTVAEARPEASRVSGAGQLVTTLLRETGDMPAPLRSTVLPAPADDANEIAALLARAVVRSGAFYESHLARWVSGEYPLDPLREEPQALHHKTTNETPASHARPEQPLRSTLLQNAAAGEIVFDCSGSESLNRGLLAGRKLLFFTSHDKVKVRFSTGPAQRIEKSGRPAFCVQFPDSMLRLQRREFYRVLAPIARPVRCVLPIDEEDSVRNVEARLRDISQGGVAIIVNPGDLPADLHTRIPNCKIALPDVGNVMVALETVYMVEMTLLNAKTVMRVGCQFVRPSMAALALVQRYMMKLERDKRARD